MAQTFYIVPTAAGEAKQANANALGLPMRFTHMAVGDGNGALPVPDRNRTALVNERRRAMLNSLTPDAANPGQFIAEQVIPENIGGWWIRELGLIDEDGVLCYYGNCAETYKPQLAEGSGRTQVVRMVIVVTGSATVEIKIDPSVVLATREYCDKAITAAMEKLDGKQSVRVATVAHLPALSGLPTVDGIQLAAGDRVLVKDQASGKDNGIYVAGAAAWSRAADADAAIEVTPGMLVPVEQGAANGDSIWQLATDAPIVLGTTALAFEMAAGRTGVTASTYRSVTVDSRGRVIGGTNPQVDHSYGDLTAYPATANLPVTAFGKANIITGTNVPTLTLPAANSAPAGQVVPVIAAGYGFVQAKGADVILAEHGLGIGNFPKVNVARGERVNFVTDGVSSWYAIDWVRDALPGTIKYFPANQPHTGYLKTNGTLQTRANYPLLAAYALASGNIIADGAWNASVAGQFSTGDGATTFRIIELRGVFIRALDDGRGVDLSRALGAEQLSALQGHGHEVYEGSLGTRLYNSGASTAGVYNRASAGDGSGGFFKAKDIITDGTNGTPNVAAETRPRNIALLPAIKI